MDTGPGHFVLNGVAEPNNQEIDVTAAQLSQLTYQSAPGTIDTLQIRAEDATAWGDWSSFTVTAPSAGDPDRHGLIGIDQPDRGCERILSL